MKNTVAELVLAAKKIRNNQTISELSAQENVLLPWNYFALDTKQKQKNENNDNPRQQKISSRIP